MSETDAPFADRWREHTRARMLRHGMNCESLGRRTGLHEQAKTAVLGTGPVSSEVMGPIDEFLDALDDGRETNLASRAITVAGRTVVPVAVESLGVLVGLRVSMWE